MHVSIHAQLNSLEPFVASAAASAAAAAAVAAAAVAAAAALAAAVVAAAVAAAAVDAAATVCAVVDPGCCSSRNLRELACGPCAYARS